MRVYMARPISHALLWRSICILFVITSLAATTTSLSFFHNFSDPGTFSNGDLYFEGDAFAADGSIILAMERLTGNTTSRSGRVSYNRPVRLRSDASGEVSSFSASFSFVVVNGRPRQRQAPVDTGGGLAFFVERYPSRMPPNSQGGCLGLFDRTTATSADPMLAVEVDSHGDFGWDPIMSPHIGVDISTLQSGKNSYKAVDGLVDGAPYILQIDYSDVTKDLDVVLRSSSSSSSSSTAGVPLVALKKSIDLSAFLPPESEVAIGISAATGASNMATHHLLWWSYDTSTNRSINSSSLTSAPDAPGTLVNPDSPSLPPVDTDPACATSGGWNHSHSHSHRLVVVGVVVFTVLSIVTAAVVTLLCVLLRSTVKGRYGSDISLGLYLSADKLLPTSERIPPQVYGEFVTIQQLVTAAFYGVGKVIKYLMRSVTKTNEGQHYHSDTVVPIALQLSHRNLLRVRQCIAGDEDEDFLLVYEYMPNGRLSDYLLKPERHLTWSMRLKIALGVGSAIEYLHGLYRPLRHGNIRADNVMLDECFNAKLGGFDAAASSKGSLSDDVLAFGALLLELVRGRRCQTTASACTNHQSVNAAILDYDDQCLDGQFDREEVQRVMLVGLWCSHPDKWQRPTIAQALRCLMSEDPLPAAITEQASKSAADFWRL